MESICSVGWGPSPTGEPLEIGPAKCGGAGRRSRCRSATRCRCRGWSTWCGARIRRGRPRRPCRATSRSCARTSAPTTIERSGTAYRLGLDARPRRRGPVPAAHRVGRRRRGAGRVDRHPLAGLEVPGLAAAATGWSSSGWAPSRSTWAGESSPTRRGHRAADRADRRPPLPRGAVGAADDRALPVGRQADALAAFQRAREHLVDELGVEPGPRLRRGRSADPGPGRWARRAAPGATGHAGGVPAARPGRSRSGSPRSPTRRGCG